MSVSFFKKLFGSIADATPVPAAGCCDGGQGQGETPAVSLQAVEAAGVGAAEIPVSIESLEALVFYIVKALVDHPEGVVLESVDKNRMTVIQIRCEKKDIGKIIGKSGKTISAVRALVAGAAGRMGIRATVDVLD